MRKLRSILIHGAIGLTLAVAIFTLGMRQGAKVNAQAHFTANYEYPPAQPAQSPNANQHFLLGDSAMGHPVPPGELSTSERKLLESVAQYAANQAEPTSGNPPMTHKRSFHLMVNHPGGTVYCFLNMYPWIYICG